MADAGEIDEPLDRAQQVVWRDMALDRELVEQRALRFLPGTHHGRPPPSLA